MSFVCEFEAGPGFQKGDCMCQVWINVNPPILGIKFDGRFEHKRSQW